MIGELLALLGTALVLIAGIGVLRFDDSLSRLHALTKASTLGVVLVFVGAAVALGRANDRTSLLLAALIQLVTSPIAASLIARSTYLDAVEDADHGPEADDTDGASNDGASNDSATNDSATTD
ncbi:MAG: monovalent cation/H(+) antiporter subunit G [Actinomycetota bacterium]|nr:monovalent cation/H(+) antiporter subunit G [Actinomycetota bacterium]